MATNWFNSDGLLVKFGTNEATPGVAGEYGFLTDGNVHVLEVRLLTLETLVDTASASAIVDENAWLPKNARIEWIDVLNVEAAATGATLDLGLIRFDRVTELDYDGLLAAAPIADWNALGETKHYMVGVTGAGALMGTVLANPGYIVATYNTAFTAGALEIRIGYSFP
jgi:hypothetical protein